MNFKQFQRYFRFNCFPADVEKRKKFGKTWAQIKTIHGRITSIDSGILNDTIEVFTGIDRWTIVGRIKEFRNLKVRFFGLKYSQFLLEKRRGVSLRTARKEESQTAGFTQSDIRSETQNRF